MMNHIFFTPGIDDKIIRRLEAASLTLLSLILPLILFKLSSLAIYICFAVGIVLQVFLMLRFKKIGKLNIFLKNKAAALLVSLALIIYLIIF